MGKPLAVDWHEVRTLALAIGVREAARRMGLPEDTVMRRCSREGWLTAQKAAKADTEAARSIVRTEQGLSAVVRTAAEILAQTGPDSRMKLAIGLNKKATHISKQKGAKIDTTDLLQATKAGAVIHGWQEKTQSGPLVSLAFYGSPAAHDQVKVIEQPLPELPDAG